MVDDGFALLDTVVVLGDMASWIAGRSVCDACTKALLNNDEEPGVAIRPLILFESWQKN